MVKIEGPFTNSLLFFPYKDPRRGMFIIMIHPPNAPHFLGVWAEKRPSQTLMGWDLGAALF